MGGGVRFGAGVRVGRPRARFDGAAGCDGDAGGAAGLQEPGAGCHARSGLDFFHPFFRHSLKGVAPAHPPEVEPAADRGGPGVAEHAARGAQPLGGPLALAAAGRLPLLRGESAVRWRFPRLTKWGEQPAAEFKAAAVGAGVTQQPRRLIEAAGVQCGRGSGEGEGNGEHGPHGAEGLAPCCSGGAGRGAGA